MVVKVGGLVGQIAKESSAVVNQPPAIYLRRCKCGTQLQRNRGDGVGEWDTVLLVGSNLQSQQLAVKQIVAECVVGQNTFCEPFGNSFRTLALLSVVGFFHKR